MTNEWDEYAADWDSDEDVIRYARLALQSLTKIVSLDGLNVLDFGCGSGVLTERIARSAHRVVGLDTSPGMIAVLANKRIPNVVTIGGELSDRLIESNPDLQTKFDLIVASSVCGFLPDYPATLRLFHSLLVPGGLFVQWDWLADGSEGARGFTENQVVMGLEESGFEAVSVSLPFRAAGPDEDMQVLMGTGKKI